MSYRLHIDVPLGTDQSHAQMASENLKKALQAKLKEWKELHPLTFENLTEFGVRLQMDGERNNRNYLDIMTNGIPSGKKIVVKI